MSHPAEFWHVFAVPGLRLLAMAGPIMLFFAPAVAEEGSVYREIALLRKEGSTKKAAARKGLREAHASLDRGEYERAAEEHHKAKRLEAEAAELARKSEGLIEKAIAELLGPLGSEEYEVRERATRKLMGLGPAAVPHLKRAATGKDYEVETRLNRVAKTLEDLSEDEEGMIHQWAAGARASSEYSTPNYAAEQAAGKPDTLQAGDAGTAWASQAADAGDEWLELSYDLPVRPRAVRVRETFCPGAVVKVEARDAEGRWRSLWEGKDPTTECPGVFEAKVEIPEWPTRAIRVTLDTSAVAGWNEIDAVELVGELVFEEPQAKVSK